MISQRDRAWNDYLLAQRLELGDGCLGDIARAATLYRRAALRGLPEAQHALGFMCATGHGVPRDETMSVHWFTAAAEQGYCAAQHNLGVMYSEGRGVSRNEELALRWFYKAALGGSQEAMEWLEKCDTGSAAGQ